MKKMIVIASLILSVLTLSACKPEAKEVKEFTFNGETYEKIGVTDDDFDLFEFEEHRIEVFFDEDILMSTVIDEDIYIILGNQESYQIKKNGETLLLCSGDPSVCSGFEDVSFKLDILDIIKAYEEVNK